MMCKETALLADKGLPPVETAVGTLNRGCTWKSTKHLIDDDLGALRILPA